MLAMFVKFLIRVAAALAVAVSPAPAAEPQSHYALVLAALEKSIVPGFENLSRDASRLPESVARVCATGDDGSREELGSAFRNTVLSWAAVEYLRFGPLADGGKRERMSFWPDPRGIMNRQLRQLIASNDAKVFEAGAIAKQSAAVQGLPALEVLLSDKELPLGPGEGSVFRCKLAGAIAANVSALSQELLDAWTKPGGWKDKMLRPGSDNDTYKEPQEAASELVKALLVGFQIVADGQVKPRLDIKGTFAGPYAKTNLAKDYFASGVKSLDRFYDAMALESYLPEEKDWVKNWAGGAWRTLRSSDGNGGRAEDAGKGEVAPVRKVFDMMSGLRKLVTSEIAVAAGLTVGFNELDGD